MIPQVSGAMHLVARGSFGVQLIFLVVSVVLVCRGDPVPEPDPARILGKYLFSYNPGQGGIQLQKKPIDLTNILDADDLYPESSANYHGHSSSSGYGSGSGYGHSSSGGSSPGFMTTYTTSTRHGNTGPSVFPDSGSDEDSDERSNFIHGGSGIASSSSAYLKRKPIIPILQSYSVIHATKEHQSPPLPLKSFSSSSSGSGSSGSGYSQSYSYSSPDDESEEDHESVEYYENAIPYRVPHKSHKSGHHHHNHNHNQHHTKARAIPISQHIEVERPVPIPYVKKIHVPIPTGVKVQIPHPVLVPVPQPYPVHVPVSQPVAVPVIKEITIPIEKIVPYPVEKKIPVPIEKPVPYPVEKHIPVHIPQPYPVKVPVVKTIVHKLKAPRTVGFGSVSIPE